MPPIRLSGVILGRLLPFPPPLLLPFALAAALLAGRPTGGLHAQTPAEITAAQQLQNAGDYAAAADALRPYLLRSPGDAGTRWLFARLLFWAGEYAEALDAYQAARARMPGDPWLELEYAQLLMEVGEWGKARTVLRRVAAADPPEAAADARRQLGEIRFLTRPWTRLTLGLLDDNQPYRRLEGGLEGGVYLTPLWSLAAGGDPRALDSDPSRKGGDAWGRIRGSVPALRLGLSAQGGATFQAGRSSWIGGAEAEVHLPRAFTLAASVGRARYLWTLASADSLVMVNAAELKLDRADAPGWAGEAVVRRESFADDNRMITAYGWVLAPLLPRGRSGEGPGFTLRGGYAFSWSDATHTRWTALPPGDGIDPGLPPAPGATIPAWYAPYFTPNDERVHSALAEVSGALGALSLRFNGSLGFHAREMAPVLIATGEGGPGGGSTGSAVFFYQRDFTPWRATVAASLPVSDALTLRARAEAWETAYYRVSQLGIGMEYRHGTWGGRAAGNLP